MNDQPALLMNIDSTKTKTFTKTFIPTGQGAGTYTYAPALGTGGSNPLVLTPRLYLAGSNTELFAAGTGGKLRFDGWDITIDGTTYTISANASDALPSGLPTGISFNDLGPTGKKFTRAQIAITANSALGSSFYAKAKATYSYSGSASFADGIPVSADITVTTILTNNASYICDLTNTNHAFPVSWEEDAQGRQIGTLRAGATADIYADVSYGDTVINDYTISANLGGDTRFTASALSGGTRPGVRITVNQDASIGQSDSEGAAGDPSDSGTFTITVTAPGNGPSFAKIFSWSAAGEGVNGADGVSYDLGVSPKRVTLNPNSSGQYTETGTITLTPRKFSGGSLVAWTDYTIAYKYGSNNYQALSGNTFTYSASTLGDIHFRLFAGTGASVDVTGSDYLDEETAYVEKAPLDSCHLAIEPESGKSLYFRNAVGNETITLYAKFYVNGSLQNSPACQWYKNGTAISGATSASYVVSANNVTSSAYFACRITHQGTSYEDGVTIVDYDDPYQVEIISSNGTVLVNGTGSTNLTCKLYRYNASSGTIAEVDSAGTSFTYTWTKGGQTFSGNTGKTITVQASDIDGTALYACTVSDSGT
ncbi:MAG: hypothetical protein II881_02760 [Oscillospiraceae bacterium]|nr:hypothetical protein [Oscillospiraceae bacterium]